MADINEKYVLYYAVRGYATGETVTISIYDTVGTKEIDAGTMTELAAGLGIYKYVWQPKKRTSYTAVMNCPTKPRQSHEIIRIEKTKLAGAITIPKTIQKFDEKTKSELFEKFSKIELIQRGISKSLTGLNQEIKITKTELNNEVHNLSKNHETSTLEQKRNVADLNASATKLKGFHSNMTELMESNLNKNYTKIKTTLESNESTNNELFKKLSELSKHLKKISVLSDEAIATTNLSNQIFNTDFKKQISYLSKNIEEFLTIENAKK